MSDASTIAALVLGRRETLLTLGLVALVVVPIAGGVGRRSAWSFGRTLAAVLAAVGLALAVAATLGRYDSYGAPRWQVRCLVPSGLSARTPEVVQGMTGMGTCQTADVVRNVAGGAVAGMAGLVWVRGLRLGRSRSG